MRPCTIKRYFVDRKTDKDHPSLALSINDGPPINIARNVVSFQLRYLETKDGETEGTFVKQQNISRQYKTQAIEVTMTARTEIERRQAGRAACHSGKRGAPAPYAQRQLRLFARRRRHKLARFAG